MTYHIQKMIQSALGCPTDIGDDFRIISINPLDYHLWGFSWNGNYYFHKCLLMGARSSCQILEQFSSALQWVMHSKYSAGGMSYILNDFFFIGPSNSGQCCVDLTNFSFTLWTHWSPNKERKNSIANNHPCNLWYWGSICCYGMSATLG